MTRNSILDVASLRIFSAENDEPEAADGEPGVPGPVVDGSTNFFKMASSDRVVGGLAALLPLLPPIITDLDIVSIHFSNATNSSTVVIFSKFDATSS